MLHCEMEGSSTNLNIFWDSLIIFMLKFENYYAETIIIWQFNFPTFIIPLHFRININKLIKKISTFFKFQYIEFCFVLISKDTLLWKE